MSAVTSFRRYLFRELYIVTVLHHLSLESNFTGSLLSNQHFKASILSSVEIFCFLGLVFFLSLFLSYQLFFYPFFAH